MPPRTLDRGWAAKHRLCVFLSVIPTFGWFGFLFMGRKSGRKQYTSLGVVYGVLSMLALSAVALSEFFGRLSWDYSITHILYWLEDNLYLYGMLALFLLWPACFAHTLLKSGEYLQYLSLRQAGTTMRSPLTGQSDWRTKNLCWMIWSYFPYLGGFSLIFAGRRLKSGKLMGLGILSLGSIWGLEMASAATYRLTTGGLSNALSTLSFSCVLIFWIVQILVAFLVREDYLDARAADWTRETTRQNVLVNPKWRASNSRWQIWTYFPYVGGVGIFLAGVRGRKTKYMVLGAVLSALVFGGMIAVLWLQNRYYDFVFTDASYPYRAAIDVLDRAGWLCYFVIIFCGCCVRWDTLVARADLLQGYNSEFDRDLDLFNRMNARNMAASQPPVQTVPQPVYQAPAQPQPRYRMPQQASQPMPQPVPQPRFEPPVPAQPQAGGLVDINRCTQDALLTLPGVGVAQAKHAVEYREMRGGFKSLDEFVEVLQIKPHFAVQIFGRATVGAAPAARPVSDSGAARRRIDL